MIDTSPRSRLVSLQLSPTTSPRRMPVVTNITHIAANRSRLTCPRNARTSSDVHVCIFGGRVERVGGGSARSATFRTTKLQRSASDNAFRRTYLCLGLNAGGTQSSMYQDLRFTEAASLDAITMEFSFRQPAAADPGDYARPRIRYAAVNSDGSDGPYTYVWGNQCVYQGTGSEWNLCSFTFPDTGSASVRYVRFYAHNYTGGTLEIDNVTAK